MVLGGRGVRWPAWAILLLSAATSLLAGATDNLGWHPEPIQLVVLGVLGVALVNIVVFVVSLLVSIPKWFREKKEEDLARVALPVLHGEPTDVGRRMTVATGMLFAACMGVIVGGVCAFFVRLLG